MDAASGNVRDKWQAREVARRYAEARFGSRRARGRDPRLVARLLASLEPAPACVLDVPCGAGRLGGALAARGARVVGADASREMLRLAPGARVLADALALPFADASFDAVVCCRLAHHLRRRDELARLLAELARVARRAVIVSFWDSASWPALRARLGLKRGEGERGRLARPRREFVELLAAAGLEPRAWRASARFLSQQTFVLAGKR